MKDKIKELLKLDFTNRLFEREATKIIECGLDKKDEIYLMNVLLDQKEDTNYQFTAFFLLFTYYRRLKRVDMIEPLIQSYASRFKGILFLEHVLLLSRSLVSQDAYDLKELMKQSRNLVQKEVFLNHTGILHYYAEMVANYFELINTNHDQLTDDVFAKDYILLAEKHIETCLKLESDYAKFYATLGRIKLLLGKYGDAIEAFGLAKFKEKPTRVDYSLVIGTYQDYLLFAKQLKQNQALLEQNKVLDANIKEVNANNMRLISMFTGLITLVIGNITVAANSQEPIKLMFMLNGMFFVFFGVVIMVTNLLTKSKNSKWLWLIASILCLMGIGILILFYTMEII